MKSCYQLLAECGFSMGTESYFATDVITRSLKNAEDTGVKFNIASSALRNNEQTCAAVVNQFKNNPNLGMWNFVDEPCVDDFKHLSELVKVIRNNDYLIIVSRDADNSQKYKISFDSRYLVSEVSPSHLASGITGEKLLPAGGFMIYRWSRK